MDYEWSNRFLNLAEFISAWSKDPSTKVGAVIVDDNRLIKSVGYNGFPRGVPDVEEHYEDKVLKYSTVVHAETNAILNAHGDVRGCHLFVWPLPTCNECAKLIIQAGIKTVTCVISDKAKWEEEFVHSMYMYREAGINVIRRENNNGLLE